MSECFGETSEFKTRSFLKNTQLKNMAVKSCRDKGGIKEMNFCVNQTYIKTIKQQVQGLMACTHIYQCTGYTWACVNGYRGTVPNE